MADESRTPLLTPEELRERRRVMAVGWHEDWKPLVDGLVEDAGFSRIEALLFLAAINAAATVNRVEGLSQHPTFHPDCAHCMKEKARQELFDRYMERALKYMDDETKGDDWKPL